MKEVAKLLTAIGTLLWPLIFLYILNRFSKPLERVLESTKTRKFTIKVAGNELTVEEASEQQLRLLSDLQSKIAKLEVAISPVAALQQHIVPGKLKNREKAIAPQVANILWVDDSPKNNSYEVALLNERGIQVDLAKSTDEGLRSFRRRHYDAVITDMQRPEGEKAGIELTRRIREENSQTPIYFFTSSWAAKNLREDAELAGATGITSSSSTLVSSLMGGRLEDS